MKIRALVCASRYWLGRSLLGLFFLSSQSSAQEVRFIEDNGHIVVIEHDGENYDRDLSGGALNVAPRQRIAQKLIETHGDFYDFIVVFTNFDFDRDGAVGFYLNVRNDVDGINLPLVDNGAGFGSPSRLQGFIDMGPVSQYRTEPFSLEPADPDFRATLGVLAHEVGHRWLASVRFDKGSGLRSDLIGLDDAHWSFLLSSDASFLYGNAWELVAGNTYRSAEVQSRFSELDLYLMGFLSPQEVTPLSLLVNPDIDATRLPELGAEIEALDVETVTIDDILAAEGARAPTHESSQKDFTVAFVFLTAESLLPTPRDLDAVELVRSSFMDVFFGLTRGRALVDPDLQTIAPVTPGAIPDTTLAIDWLVGQQRADGRYEAHPLTAIRDTAIATSALSTLGVRGPPVDDALAWLALQNPTSVDFVARIAAVGAGAPMSPETLLSLRNTDGGFGIAPGYRSEPLDTALALIALADSGVTQETIDDIAEVLVSMQLADGSFSSIAGQPGDVMTTSEAALALAFAATHTAELQSALAWLVARQAPDGGLGEGPSSPSATARALEALLNGTAPPTAIDGAIEYLQQTQSADGSWSESVFETAAVLRALVPSTVANLAIDNADVFVDPDPPEVGELVTVEVTVRNRGRVPAGTFDVQLFDGDPELGGLAIGAPHVVDGLVGGSSRVLEFSWDTSGLEGLHTLFAIADFAGAVAEISKDDNVALRDIEVLPPLPNLVVTQMSADPARPIVGDTASVTIRIENIGTADADASLVRLSRELPRLGIEIGETATPPLAPGASSEISLPWDTTGHLGINTLHVVVDPDDGVRERTETDNVLSLAVDVRPPPPAQPDLEIAGFVLSPNELERLPQTVTASARIINTGLDPVPAVLVDLFQGHPDMGGVRVTGVEIAVGGDTGVDVVLDFDVATGGTRTFYLRVDAGATVERDDTNNLASADLRDLMDVVDVTFDPGSLVLSPPTLDPGQVLTVDVGVQNTGTRSLSSVTVALFYEISPGSFGLASTLNVPIDAGSSEIVRLTWTANRSGTVPLELRVDPNNALSETNEDDNVLATTIDVTASTLANLTLAPTDITTVPATLFEGAAARLDAVVRNVGDGAATAFDVEFFIGDPERAGRLIGSVPVSGLDARTETVVSVDWDPVQARGESLVVVRLDSGAAVDEIDELDNLVFRVIDVVGLPDLLSTTAQVRLTPPFARSGDIVTIDASFTNAGEQTAAPMGIEIRLDDPVSGSLVASEDVGELGAGETGNATVSWDTSGIEGEHELYLILDVRDDVIEQREDNNVTRVPVALQDADFFVAPVFFSPNGDGVQDETTLFYRVSVSSELTIEVRNADDNVVREIAVTPGESGSATWDGRRDDGVLARDGAYFLVLVDAGVELLRRRVVLDTDRSPIVEALGSELVTFTQLTCPMPTTLNGPAWLPNDRAAYVIVAFPDPEVPDFPLGLYRVSSDARSLEPVLADDAFLQTTFVDSVVDFSEKKLPAVSADGENALIRNNPDGIQVLELATGLRTPLGHDASASAMWTSDGRRILVGSADGVVFHGANGDLLETVVVADVDVALLAPDESRIVYRRSDETVLRVVNTNGSGDRILESTDATSLFFRPPEADALDVDELYFLEDGDGPVFRWFFQNEEEGVGPFAVDLAADTISNAPDISTLSSDEQWNIERSGAFFVAARRGGRETRPILPTVIGRDLAWSYRDTQISYDADGGDGCVGRGIWTVRSLLNAEASFRLTRLPSRFGVQITGTVADANLSFYTLEFASIETPDVFTAIQPPSAVPVIADTITTWIPPAAGDYLVRLTLRDRAGNEIVRLDRIFWDETPPIANLRRQPTYVSPNGDGVQDDVLVEYDVLSPANLVFHIRDDEGRSVRAIERNELALGPASFVWDGTDDFGVTVDDGDYVVEIEGAEFPIVVDNSPPDISAEYSELYTFIAKNTPPRLAVDLEGRILDENLEAWELTDVDGEVFESAQREIGSDSEDAMIKERGRPKQGLELRARDRAGNEVVAPLAGPSREVRVVRSGAKAVGPLSPGPASEVEPEFVEPRSGVSYAAQASFVGPLRFTYSEVGGGGPVEPVEPVEIETVQSVTIAAADLELGATYIGRFESDGIQSREVEFTVGPSAIFLAGAPTSLGTELIMTNTVDEPLVEGRLVRNGVDVLRVYRPVPSRDTLVVGIPACGLADSFRVEATGESGTIYRSTTQESYPLASDFGVTGVACLSVDDAGIEVQANLESPIPNEARALVRNSLGSIVPEEVALLLRSGAGIDEVGRVVGTSDNVTIPFDVDGLAEGNYSLHARAILPDSSTIEGDFALGFVLDQSPPLLSIISPAQGGVACVGNVEGRAVVDLDVEVDDREIRELGVELLLPDGRWEPVGVVDAPKLPLFGRFSRVLSVIVPGDLSGETTFRLSARNARITNEIAERPASSPPRWPVAFNNGGLRNALVRSVIVSPTLGLGPLTTEPARPALFSPNADGIVDEMRVRGNALENADLTVRIFTAGASPVLVRTLVAELPTATGDFELVWDGRNDGGSFVADGEYRIEVEAVNGCGGVSTKSTIVEVDNTVPTVSIDNLVDDQPVTIAVDVEGIADDDHFESYVVELGEGAAPLTFSEIFPPVFRRVPRTGLLGSWSIGDIAPGTYTLRLTATDIVGNRASTDVRVEVLAADFIAGYEVEPALFSPNGDGVADEAEIRIELKTDARVTLSILDSGEALVATLVDGVVLTEGAHVEIWDGGGAPDGDYFVQLRAENPTVSTLFEESRIGVTLDTLAPEILIGSPVADGFVSVPSTVSGNISDEHLERFTVEVGPVAGPLAVIAEDSVSVTGVIASLRDLGDGSFRLRANANDVAGNTAELELVFDVDSTPPVLTLTAPESGIFVTRVPDAIAVVGSVDELNLERYDVELGFGDPPSVFTPLAGGVTVPTEPTLATWDLQALPDGPYTIRLSASDRAANFALVETNVTLDTTPPIVIIEAPAPDAVIAEPLVVRGTLTDVNFRAGALFVAPAARPEQLTEIASFTEPIAGGELVVNLALSDGDYIVELHAEDLAGNEAATMTTFLVDTEPPLPPSNLTTEVAGTDVTLRFSASPSADVVGYHVERDGVRITAVPIATTSYLDLGLDEGLYRYTVVAIDRADLESEPAGPAAATIDLTPPVTLLRSPDEGDRVRVEVDVIGTAFAEDDFFEYRLSAAPAETPLSPTLVKRSAVPVSFDTLGRWQPLVDGDYILTLESEDVNGNVGEDSVRVTVDNAPPGAPVLERAEALPDPDDVEIEWSGPSDTDVDGFLVFRNGQIANAPGTVSGSLRPFLVPGPTYVDADLPDGEHCYRVAAMDVAGNLSGDSNELCVFLDNREPAAVIIDPEDGARFDTSRAIRAESEDLDIATVSFEYQLDGDVAWTLIAIDSDGAPFEVVWDIIGLAFGDYRLRAVATDIGTRSDPAPASIAVVLGDSTPPPAPDGLTARTLGDRVELSWNAVDAVDLAAYRVFRGETMVLEPGAGDLDAIDVGVPDGEHDYVVRAVDGDGNVSEPSNSAAARVYAPSLLPPFPVVEAATIDLSGADAVTGASVRLYTAGTLDELATTTADPDGAFQFSSLALVLGSQLLEAEATDADANVSRRSPEALLVRNDVPATPSGLAALASDGDAELSWSANSESDLSGYLVTRDGELLNDRGLLRPTGTGVIPTDHTADASANAAFAPRVIGGFSSWFLSAGEQAWIEITLSEPRHLDEIRLRWVANRSAKDYDVLVEFDGTLAPIVRVRDAEFTNLSTHTLPIPLQTTRVRLDIFSHATQFGILLDEFELIGIAPITDTAFVDTPTAPGLYDYAVEAIDTLGGRSVPAGPINLGVGDLTPPEPPTALVATASGEDVSLGWTASPSPDVSSYRVFRDGELIANAFTTSHLDRDLLNGTYTYFVVAVDVAGNESAPSNEDEATVDVAAPPPPVLTVSSVPEGRALTLVWSESIGPLPVSSYIVARSEVSGGPYTDIAQLNGGTFELEDIDLVDGVEVFYVVRAVDSRGQEGDPSNEASGTPTDTLAPAQPSWVAPESPQVVMQSGAHLVGASEPATTVDVVRDGVLVGQAVASAEFALLFEPFVRTNANIAGRFAISPERTLVAEMGTNSAFSSPEAHIYDVRTGERSIVPYDEDRSFERDAAFSPDGRRVAVSATGGVAGRAIRILDLDTETTDVIALVDVPNTLAWVSNDELAVVMAGSDIRILDLVADTETTIYSATSGFEPQRLIASPDGAFLGWSESSALYVMPSAGGVPELVFDNFRLDEFVWSAPTTLVFNASELGVHFYDVDTMITTLIEDTETMHTLRSVGVGDTVSAIDGATLFWILANGDVIELDELPLGFNTAFVEWGTELSLTSVNFEPKLVIYETPGRFTLDTRLVSGVNTFVARARDAAGNESPDSDVLELTYDTSALADLAIDGAITVIPSAPRTGDSASLSLSILNRGESSSTASLVGVSGSDINGNVYAIGSSAIPELTSGQRASVSVSWSTAGRLGPQSLLATVDPLELLDEADETNNTATTEATVVGSGGVELSIAAGRARYSAGQLVELTISSVNGGASSDFVFETIIEDTSGAAIADVDSRSVSLGYAGSTRYATFWTAGSIAADIYVARVNALVGAEVVATATTTFELERTLTLTLAAVTDRSSYEQGNAVNVLARIANENSNTALRDLTLRYRIVDPSSGVAFETAEPLSYLAIGGALSSDAVWVSGANEPGIYRVVVDALEASDVLASTETSFELTAASTERLSGTLTLSLSAVPAGSDVVAAYTIDNESVVDLVGGTVKVELYDTETLSFVAQADEPLAVDGGAQVVGELRLDTTGVELGGYSVVLSAGTSTLAPLASAPVTLFATPAAPSLNAPADGASAAQQLLLSINNATNPNNETLTYEFEIYFDEALTIPLSTASGIPEGVGTTAWAVLTFLQENRHYFWRARARDRFAVSDWMVPADVFVDSANDRPDPPVLSAPAESSEVDVLRPALVVGNAVDLDSDLLTYTFELYRDAGLTDLAFSVSGIPETDGTTSFIPSDDLMEDATYFWRARANDGELDGDWMATASFRVNTANQAPNAPTPLEPLGPRVATLTPELVVGSAVDPEGDPITHTFQIDVSESFDTPARQESAPLDDVRWIPPTALDENAVYFWRVRAADALASGPWSDTVTFRVDVANEPPEAPTPQRPGNGSVVESAVPVLAVINATDPEDDPLTYVFEVYEDEALTSLVARIDALTEGVGETAWTVSPRLDEETQYYWIAFANDGRADGAPTATQSFRVNVMNEEPTAPTLVSPLPGAIVSEIAPTLLVSNASDPDGDPLSYFFEVYDDELLTAPVLEASGEIDEGVGETSWTMSVALEENRLYYWRARAFDGRLDSAWMATARFRFSLDNEAPATPILLTPDDGDVVSETQPTLTITPSTDPEDDIIRYTFEVFRDVGLAELVARSTETEETSWVVDVELDENQTFYWQVNASDGDLTSAPSASFHFIVNALDEPPTIPNLAAPGDGVVIDTDMPVLVVDNAVSPDGAPGEPLVYHFALYTDAALSDVLAEDVSIPEGTDQTSWEPPVTLNPGDTYYWRVRAIDARGLMSEWATAFSFTVEPPTGDCPPEWKDDFERYPKQTSPAGWQLDTEKKDPRFRVKTLAGSQRLVSSSKGRGSLFFVGNGEALDWRNYQLEGELRLNGVGSGDDDSSDDDSSDDDSSDDDSSDDDSSDDDSSDDDSSDDDSSDDDSSDDDSSDDDDKSNKRCTFATGVAFYARPSAGTAYRLEIIGPQCRRPKARIVKIASGDVTELARVSLSRNYQQHSLRFHIEAVNHPSGTSLTARINGRVGKTEKEWTVAVEDTQEPLRGGTIGAWSNFARASWDNFHVREIQGLSSGISGDADGDGVCDIDAPTSAHESSGARVSYAVALARLAKEHVIRFSAKVHVQHRRWERFGR